MVNPIPLNEKSVKTQEPEDKWGGSRTGVFPIDRLGNASVPSDCFLLFQRVFLNEQYVDTFAEEAGDDQPIHVRWFRTKEDCNEWLRTHDLGDGVEAFAGVQMKGPVYGMETHQIVTRFRLKEWT
jgi:hypothetical protein